MADYSVQAPDGRTYQIQGPAGASQAQVVARVLEMYPESGNRPAQPGRFARAAREAGLSTQNRPDGSRRPDAPARSNVASGASVAGQALQPGRFRSRPAGITPGSVEAYMHMWQDVPPERARQIYYQERARLQARITDPAQQMRALAQANSSPAISALRQLGGLARVSTTRREIADVADRARNARTERINEESRGISRDRQARHGNFGTALISGLARGTLGIPERLAAAFSDPFLDPNRSAERPVPIHTYAGSTLRERIANRDALVNSEADEPLNYEERLQRIRGAVDSDLEGSTPGNIIGQVISGALAFGGLGKLLGLGAGALASTASPVAQRAGNVLQNLGTLQRGQGARNAGRIALMGAGAGAAQSAGEGSNIVRGTAIGAVAAPLLGLGFKAVQVITRPVRDILRLSSADRILSRLTTMSRAQLSARAQAHRDATGAEPTLFEILPLADRNRLLSQAVVGRGNVVERAAGAIRARAGNIGREMTARVRNVLKPKRDAVEDRIFDDLADARGGMNMSEDAVLTGRAARSPTDMSELRDAEARAIMAPHENTQVVNSFDDLYPSIPGPGGLVLAVDPEMNAVLRSAAGTLKVRPQNAGVTAGEITDMISVLRADLGKGGNEGRAAERAIQHLQRTLDDNAPEAGEAARRMSEAYAARSRMLEGQKEGAATRLRDDIPVGTNRREARRVRNAYDTPEGEAGRALGQENRLLTDLGGSPEEALRATIGISRNSTSRQLAQNLGDDEAAQIGRAARAQDDSAQALASASSRMQGGGDVANAESLVQALAALHPATFITTKLGSLRRLMSMTYIPESRARAMVDMLFSQNPAMMQRALKAIGNERNGATFLRYLATVTGQVAAGRGAPDFALDGSAPTVADLAPEDELPEGEEELAPEEDLAPEDGELPEGEELPENELAPESEEEELPAEEENSDARPVADGDSPYAPQLQQIYDAESPELLSLLQRIEGQESRGRQHGRDGRPLTSRAGAIGVMQVMPTTAPAAARMAGLRWDPQAYRHDATYNRLLGIAYLSEMLRRYEGNVRLALIAYNAGPGRADAVRAGRGRIPAETRDYLERIM